MKQLLTICIHEVGEGQHQCSVDTLEKIIATLESVGLHPYREVEGLCNKVDESVSFNDMGYVLTFDDGTRTIKPALDYLATKKIVPIVFISTYNTKEAAPFWWTIDDLDIKRFRRVREVDVHIQRLNLRPSNKDLLPLSFDELVYLERTGIVEIGSHANHHEIFTKLGYDEILNEINNSDKIFKEYGLSPRYFAYPNGNYSNKIGRILSKRFELCFTGVHAVSRENTPAYSMPRFFVTNKNYMQILGKKKFNDLYRLYKYFRTISIYKG